MVLCVDGVRLGLTICEDIWEERRTGRDRGGRGEADVIVNLSMSPYHRGKGSERERHAGRAGEGGPGAYRVLCQRSGRARRARVRRAELVFDPRGSLVARGGQFEEELLVVDVEPPRVGCACRARLRGPRQCGAVAGGGDRGPDGGSRAGRRPRLRAGAERLDSRRRRECREPLSPEGEVYSALCLGVSDYARKNGFKQVVIGHQRGHRLGAHRLRRRRRAGRRQGQHRLHAFALFQRGYQERRA